jgi:hypothetical protein
MESIKRSMTFAKGDPRSPKFQKERKITIQADEE